MKTFLKFYITLTLILSPILLINSANAANVGGWNLSNPVAQGASAVYDATKNVLINGQNYVKDSWVKISPNASQVSKVLARGAAGYALSVAVEQLIGSVDWVLDPANNRVTYYPLSCNNNPSCLPQYTYVIKLGSTYYPDGMQQQACENWLSNWQGGKPKQDGVTVTAQGNICRVYGGPNNYNGNAGTTYQRIANPAYDPDAEREEKYLPLDVVASQVISNAEAGDTDAQVATTAAAADIVAEAETDQTKARPIANQAEANATTKPANPAEAESANEATGEATPNTANPEATDITLDFPVFCNWAPTICEAAQVAISFPNTLTGWWETSINAITNAWTTFTEYLDWTKEEDLPNRDTSDITLPDTPITPQSVNVNFGKSCPAPTTVNISFAGQSKEITIMNYQFICEWSWVVEYSVIALASISSVFIVAGRKS